MNEQVDLLALFKAKREEIGATKLAEELDISSATVRSICTDNYAGKTDKVLAKFGAKYIDVVLCPHVDRQLTRKECRIRHTAPKPFGGEAKKAWWETCQTCKHKGE